jgi:hypothetical protein
MIKFIVFDDILYEVIHNLDIMVLNNQNEDNNL